MRHLLAVAFLVAACADDAGPIAPAAPKGLSLPDRIEFPPTVSFATTWAEGVVRNDGPAPIDLRIETKLPFGPPLRQFVLRPGEERVVRFTFQGNGYADAGFAFVYVDGELQKFVLTGTTLHRCGDPCHVRSAGDACGPAPDGTACGQANECNDGATCRAGACLPAPPRDGAACQTECGADGTCADALCFSPAPEEEPVWTSPQTYASVVHVDAAGVLVGRAGYELGLLDDRGRQVWRIADPLRRRFHPPAQDGLLFFEDDQGRGVLDLRTGAETWHSAAEPREWLVWLTPTMVQVVGRDEDEDEDGGRTAILRAIDRRDGTEVWRRELLRRAWSALGKPLPSYHVSAGGNGDRLWVAVSGTDVVGPEGRYVREWVLFDLDPANGAERWARRGDGEIQQIFFAEEDAFLEVWHHYRKGEVHALDADGHIRWSVETGTADHYGQSANGPRLVIGGSLFLEDGSALDRVTGSPRPRAPVTMWTIAQPIGSTVFGAIYPAREFAPKAIVGFDPASGEPSFRLPLQTLAFRSVANGEELLVEVDRARDRVHFDSLLCRFDRHGRLLEERRLPMQAAARTATAPHPPDQLWFRTFEDRIEAWPLPE